MGWLRHQLNPQNATSTCAQETILHGKREEDRNGHDARQDRDPRSEGARQVGRWRPCSRVKQTTVV